MTLPALILANVFVQANTVRGYRYLDDAGKVMNRFDGEFSDKRVGSDLLEMVNPDATFRTFRVNTTHIWTHFSSPDTTTLALDQSRNAIETVAEIISVSTFSRVGVRIQYVIPVVEGDFSLARRVEQRTFNADLMQAISDMHSDDLVRLDLLIPLKTALSQVNLRINTAKKQSTLPGDEKLPETALMIDVDIYRNGEFSMLELGRTVRDAGNWTAHDLPRVIDYLVGERKS